MKILYIYRNPNMGFSIGRVFRPIEMEMRKYAEVDSLYLPVPNYSAKGLWRNIMTSIKTVKSKQYDIVHITGSEHYLIPFLYGHRVVVTVHDLGFYFNDKGKKLTYPLKHILFVFSLKFAKCVTFISKKSEDECLKVVHLKKSRCFVINNPVNPNYSFVHKDFNSIKPCILHIGTAPHKNLRLTIEALAGVPCELRIIGKISCEDKARMKELGIDFSCVENLTDKQIYDEYCNCDIVNFPSTYEGYGMPIIEGQAIGRVILTSDIPPMNDIAGDGAIFVDPNSIMNIRNGYLTILKNCELRERLVGNGLRNVDRFNVRNITRIYMNIYNDIKR